ncbi:hypothetical protein [Aquibium oceanicum]|uniref:Type II secretion system protein n=1 Tax=Aquibium oceanicum TaxID=1670800 RepID=A0A1L3SVR4_9HYPH|nr:hypothetical protein [Aquibium oceanicum]APH73470.1 hypothetical protein BSQ44_20420 [Aquibium oceanicum]
MTLRPKRGFMLIEVLAAFVIALLMMGPVTAIIGGVAGSFGGLERSAERRQEQQDAATVAMGLEPLREGERTVGDFLVRVEPYDWGREDDLDVAGWRLYLVSVLTANSGLGLGSEPLFETVRIGRP